MEVASLVTPEMHLVNASQLCMRATMLGHSTAATAVLFMLFLKKVVESAIG